MGQLRYTTHLCAPTAALKHTPPLLPRHSLHGLYIRGSRGAQPLSL